MVRESITDPAEESGVDRGTTGTDTAARGVATGIGSARDSAYICGVGTAFPPNSYSQDDVRGRLNIQHPTVHKLLAAQHIHERQLYLPDPPAGQRTIDDETPEMLHRKFDQGVLDIGQRAIRHALAESPLALRDVEFLICVTSSGFRVPGVSSMIARALDLPHSLYRLDVVGMGCNAGLSALRTASALTQTGMKGVLLCCEVNSAIYIREDSIRTGIVNSLFGDGAAAFVLAPSSFVAPDRFAGRVQPRVVGELRGFSSFTIPEQWSAMRFDWHAEQGKWSFGLSKHIPFVISENLSRPVAALLEPVGLTPSDIDHWVIHTGGAAVIEGAKKSLGLTEFDVRHTRSVLRDHGNISSGSFMVSYSRLVNEGVVEHGDSGVLIAMGPGATLEAALVQFSKAQEPIELHPVQ